MALLFENSDWLVVDKPTGLSTHGAYPGDTAMQEWLDLHWDRKTYVCSRLDKGTSGVLILAKTPDASGRAQKIHESETSAKEYVFLSSRVSDRGEWKDATPLDGAPARTEFRRLETARGRTRYRALIRRGRMHQIRRHARHSGVPILGDDEYGGGAAPRLYLHCRKIDWPEIPGGLEAPIPPSFDEPRHIFFDRRLDYLPSITDAFRCIDRGEVPGVKEPVDLFGGHAAASPILKEIARFYPVEGAEPLEVTEHGLRYRASGFWPALRDLRRRVFRESRGKRVAVLRAADGSLSAAAAAGGAEVVCTLGGASSRLNFSANGLDKSGRGKFVRETPRRWLERQRHKPPWDLVVCAAAEAPLVKAVLSSEGRAYVSGAEKPLKQVFASVERQSPPLDFPGGVAPAIFLCR